MIKIDDLITINRKLSLTTYTNSELIELLKDQNSVNYLNTLMDCEQKFPEDNPNFLNCFSESCPTELKDFQTCVKENKKNTENCIADSLRFENCLTRQAYKIMQVLSKSHSFKV